MPHAKGSRRTHFAVLVSAAVFLFFFHARWQYLVSQPVFWAVDDGCYASRIAVFTGVAIPPACERSSNFYAPGASIAWLPAGLLARLSVDAFSGSGSDWLIAWISLFSFLFWSVALWACAETVLLRTRRIDIPFALAVCIGSPAFYYAIHRQTLAHPAEWLCASLLALCLARKQMRYAALAAIALALTRYNDAPAALMVIGAAIDRARGPERARTPPLVWPLVSLPLALALWIEFSRSYGGDSVLQQLRSIHPGVITHSLLSFDQGVLWENPWLMSIALAGALFFRKLTWTGRAALVWIWSEILLTAVWSSQNGGIFGNRYLTGSFAGALWISLEFVSSAPAWAKILKILKYWALISAGWSLLLTQLFIGLNATGIGMSLLTDPYGNTRRIMTEPFLSTALKHALSPEIHSAALRDQFPLVVWLQSTVGDGPLHGPTLGLLALACGCAMAFLVIGLRRDRA